MKIIDLSGLPVTLEATIPESYLDDMGHMNVMWYIHLFSRAAGEFFQMFGLHEDYFTAHQAGTFALEMHVRYLAEVRVGQRVIIRSRAIGRSAKCFHFMHFMVHADSGVLAATEEVVGTHVNLRTRRTAPMPPEVAEALDRLLAEHRRLPWEAPICGVMKP
jgi:acyl-CoA thioester hydrolase